MKKKKNVEIIKEIYHHYHNDWNKTIRIILGFLILLIFITSMLGMLSFEQTKEKMIYSKCAESCSQKHFSGLQIGADVNQVNQYGNFVNEFDRTNCLKNCNDLYLNIISKE